ncbi:LamG domain-containing protein, partial [Streptococcus pneumoniae]|uniref:LamG domain-containing protein n=1 Tax=Streptococcus pneumoniae TaxID=1313 RepID=UPI001E4A6718
YPPNVAHPATDIGAGKGIQVTDGVWQHITFVKRGVTQTKYKNGIYVGQTDASNASLIFQSPIRLGACGFDTWRPFVGNLED